MAIDRIPGVGPTNADIATAVAAPSAATIASAVAAPSAATIAAAVAAPSSATIASAVAAAVPTNASITSIVQANAGSPFAGVWTNLGVITSTSQTVSFTGLSSYKYLRFAFWYYNSTLGSYVSVRINNDNGANYTWIGFNGRSASPSYTNPIRALTANEITVQQFELSAGQYYQMNLEIFGAQSGAYKTFTAKNFNQNASIGSESYEIDGMWRNTSAVSSVAFSSNRSTNNNWTIYAQGAN